ncbi:MAG: hypothetical protein CVV05_00580 [Gammaproteobacteria bacterium HGW-Gammaproteobacteria-1]|jgi:hypothetical protein|nr:MAG: hypothetical protein CVV05_00580 [Gammaproteobacteria bacterium HGW-Gammaproteobacteria-1]
MVEIIYITTPVATLSGQHTRWGIKADLRSKSYLALGVSHPKVPAWTNTLLLSKEERQQRLADGVISPMPLVTYTVKDDATGLQELCSQRRVFVQVFRRKAGAQAVTVIMDMDALDSGEREALLGVSFDPAMAGYLATQVSPDLARTLNEGCHMHSQVG